MAPSQSRVSQLGRRPAYEGFELKAQPASRATQAHRLTGININQSYWSARLSTAPWVLNVYEFRQHYQWVGFDKAKKRG